MRVDVVAFDVFGTSVDWWTGSPAGPAADRADLAVRSLDELATALAC